LKLITTLILGCCIFLFTAYPQSGVTIKINPHDPGSLIPTRFIGLSFETASLLPDYAEVKGYFFDSTNTQLLTLFKNIGIKSLRIGGGTVDKPQVPIPKLADIDALFRFAKAAGVKVIYSFRLQNGDSLQDASTAKYIWKKYRQYLDHFSIGNEPNYKFMDPTITDYSTFLAKWRRFADVVLDSVPYAKLGGPDAAGSKWGEDFGKDEFGSGIVDITYFHNYTGRSAEGKTPHEMIDKMLSPVWDTANYPSLYERVSTTGFPYSFTEANSFTADKVGVWGGNNCFATALYALDYLYWWAEHNCQGVHYHTYQWKYNGTITKDDKGNFQINPMGYGIKAFDLGGHGRMKHLSISNPDNINLTAYAVQDTTGLFITIINKEHGSAMRNAKVNILVDDITGNASVIFLNSPHGVSDITGMTLGGSQITNSETWKGKWALIKTTSAKKKYYTVDVPASSAAIIKIIKTNNY